MISPSVRQFAVERIEDAASELEAPPDVAERFQGRLFSQRELEERGVRLAGGRAWYRSAGVDWSLHLRESPRS